MLQNLPIATPIFRLRRSTDISDLRRMSGLWEERGVRDMRKNNLCAIPLKKGACRRWRLKIPSRIGAMTGMIFRWVDWRRECGHLNYHEGQKCVGKGLWKGRKTGRCA